HEGEAAVGEGGRAGRDRAAGRVVQQRIEVVAAVEVYCVRGRQVGAGHLGGVVAVAQHDREGVAAVPGRVAVQRDEVGTAAGVGVDRVVGLAGVDRHLIGPRARVHRDCQRRRRQAGGGHVEQVDQVAPVAGVDQQRGDAGGVDHVEV